MIALNILLWIAVGISFLLTVGETNPPMSKERRRGAAVALVTLVALIIALNTIM